jgi:hypothetical protein
MNLFIKRSSRKNKKYDLYRLSARPKTGPLAETHEYILSFGDSRYSDVTLHKDEKRKELYIIRHKKMKIGINLAYTRLASGAGFCYGIRIH